MKTKTRKPTPPKITMMADTADQLPLIAKRIYDLSGQAQARIEEIKRLKDLICPLLPLGKTRAGRYKIQKTHFNRVMLKYWRKSFESITVDKLPRPVKSLGITAAVKNQ